MFQIIFIFFRFLATKYKIYKNRNKFSNTGKGNVEYKLQKKVALDI